MDGGAMGHGDPCLHYTIVRDGIEEKYEISQFSSTTGLVTTNYER